MDVERLHGTENRYGVPQERRYGAAGLFDYRRMIEELAPDGVYAIGDPDAMYPVWIWCLQQGLNLYIEKPMGLTMHQAQMLAFLAEERGCMTQVSFQRRNCPLLVAMREECLKRGPISHAVCEMFKCERTPYFGARGNMMNDCIHSVDTIRWMCGGEVAAVESHCKRIGTPDINWIGATLQFDNGSTGFVISSWRSGRRIWRMQMHVPGIYTDAEIEGKAYLYADGDYAGVVYDPREIAGSDDLRVYGGFQDKHREFIDSLLQGRELTSSPFRDAVKTMEAAERILAQAILDGE